MNGKSETRYCRLRGDDSLHVRSHPQISGNGVFVAAAYVNAENACWAQEMYGAQEIYTDLDGMLANAEIDAVIIGTPVYHHLENAIAAAEAGKHILCEKPMARTVGECD